jgi:hypothetical protein
MQFLCETIHAAFPTPRHQRAACFANEYRQLYVVQCRYLTRMLTADAGVHTVRTSSGLLQVLEVPCACFPSLLLMVFVIGALVDCHGSAWLHLAPQVLG